MKSDFNQKLDLVFRGIIFGFISGAAVAVLILIEVIFFSSFLLEYPDLSGHLLSGALLLTCMLIGVAGAILGAIYALFFKHIPGKTAIIKGIILAVSPFLAYSLFIYGIFLILIIFGEPNEISLSYIIRDIISYIYPVLYGIIIGKLWDSEIL